jgi:hypothetical protein
MKLRLVKRIFPIITSRFSSIKNIWFSKKSMCFNNISLFLPQHYVGFIECQNLMDLLWTTNVQIMSIQGSSHNVLLCL